MELLWGFEATIINNIHLFLLTLKDGPFKYFKEVKREKETEFEP